MSETNESADLIDLAASIVSAYVARNSVPVAELPALINSVYSALGKINGGAPSEPEVKPLKPAVSVKKSIQDDFIICLEDGKRFKSLKRHLSSAYGMTLQDYRLKWGLPKDYPMVAPAYAKQRSALALSLGLGRKAKQVEVQAPAMVKPDPEPAVVPAKARRSRAKEAPVATAAKATRKRKVAA
jgi:predicted transcriptional regulator